MHLQRGMDWLAVAATDLVRSGALPRADGICDGLLDLVGQDLEDDVALLALHVAAP